MDRRRVRAVLDGVLRSDWRSIRAGRLVTVDGFRELPGDVLAEPPRTSARVAFVAGEDNKCFLPESQVRSFEYLDRLRPGFHSLVVLPGYGHLDVFLGQRAATDVFPRLLDELARPRETAGDQAIM